MFLKKTIENNKKLLDVAVKMHKEGKIYPDTYVIDMDTLRENAKLILNEANKYNMKMYFMLKQLGRNPYIAKELIKLGYDGAVVVDFKEAELMMKHDIKICNVGHLVQPPKLMLQKLVDYQCEYFTVYSLEKLKDINNCAKKSGILQKVLIRVVDKNDLIYSGQTAGIHLDELDSFIEETQKLESIKIAGVTSFPCFLYDEKSDQIQATNNMNTVLMANKCLTKHGIDVENMNTPSTTCVHTIKEMAKFHATSGEPGHGLTGTTPYHENHTTEELPCVIYLSEISHNFEGKAYCYGGGHYRRSHVKNAVIGDKYQWTQVNPPTHESIDYHFELEDTFNINQPVIMAFRFQMFVTRSDVCIVEGIHTGNPTIEGIYTSLGVKL